MIGISTTNSPDYFARRDTETYGRALLARGGTDIFSNGAASLIVPFWRQVYSVVPRGSFGSAWLGKRAQNMGTGSLLLDFFGANHGTMTSGLAWGSDGFDSTPADSYLATSPLFPSITSPITIILTLRCISSLGTNPRFIGTTTSPWHANSFTPPSNPGILQYDQTSGILRNTGLSFPGSGFHTVTIWQLSTTQGAASVDSGTQSIGTASAFAATGYPFSFTRSGTNRVGAYVAFFAYVNGTLNKAQSDAIHSALKSTICQGMGLP